MATLTSSASRDGFVVVSAPPPTTLDEQLIAILDAPIAPYQTASEAFARKERELGERFMALPASDARELQFRLTACRPADRLAIRFARLSLVRRARLLGVLFHMRRCSAKVSP